MRSILFRRDKEMANAVQSKVKTFEVGFKEYYHQLSDWTSENIKAKNKKENLIINK